MAHRLPSSPLSESWVSSRSRGSESFQRDGAVG